MILLKKEREDGTPAACGKYDTSGDMNRGSPVAAAIASTEPGSGVSGAAVACGNGAASTVCSESITTSADLNMARSVVHGRSRDHG